jgi:hypothetical protein
VSRGRLGRALAAPSSVVRRATVRREVGDREEERPRIGRPAVDEVDGPTRIEVSLVGAAVLLVGDAARLLDLGARAVGDQTPVLVDAVVEEVVGRRVHRGVPLLPPRRDEAGTPRPVAVQVLADVRGGVARITKPDGQGVVGVELVEAALGGIVAAHAVVVRVLAGEVGRPRGAAQREGREVVREGRARAPDQLADALERAHLLHGLVVRHDDDHVRPGRHALGVRGTLEDGGPEDQAGDRPERNDRRSPPPGDRWAR